MTDSVQQPTLSPEERLRLSRLALVEALQPKTSHRQMAVADTTLNTTKTEPTHQVTGLENVLREDSPEDYFILQLIMAESSYFILLNKGWKPEEARDVLPNATKTEIMMTGFIDDWKHFFDLRCSKSAHPQMRELACGLREEFIKRNYITK